MTVRRPLTLVDRNNFREMTNLGGEGMIPQVTKKRMKHKIEY